MKLFPFLLLLIVGLTACTSTPPTPPIPTLPPTPLLRQVVDTKAIKAATLAFQQQYGDQYDRIAYSVWIDSAFCFVVTKGNWSIKEQKKKVDKGAARSYKMGLVTAQNEVLIPLEFDKIYNLGATAHNLFEVEQQGQRGFYDYKGKLLLATKYDALYPAATTSNSWAYWRQGDQYGVLYGNGTTANLTKAPDDFVQNWAFDAEKTSLFPFFNVRELLEREFSPMSYGVLVFPSYLYDLSVTPEYEYKWSYGTKKMGMVNAIAQIETLATPSNTTLLTAFDQAFSASRDYHDDRQAVVTVDQHYVPVDSILIQTLQQLPICAGSATIHLVGTDTLEIVQPLATPQQAYSFQTTYRYYHLQKDGQLKRLPTQGDYAASQYVPLTAAHFKGCFARALTAKERANLSEEEELASFEVSQHLSLDDLQYMRQEIYARHGYVFKEKEWQARFAKEPWYQANEAVTKDMLSPVEQYNVQFLLDYAIILMKQEKELRQTQYKVGKYAG